MKIVLAPQSFKGTFSGIEICDLLYKNTIEVYPEAEIIKQPIGDGGDGTLDILIDSLKGELKESTVFDAHKNQKIVKWGFFPNKSLAYIESATICGMASLDRSELNVLTATSFGIGQCITDILDVGINHIIIGLGGSATNDGGSGLLTALGVKFLNSHGQTIRLGGGGLVDLAIMDTSKIDPRLKHCRIEVACDVDNSIMGSEGATRIYSQQKGASPKDLEVLEKGIKRFVELTKQQYDIDISKVKYGGAAGGIAAGLHAYLGAELLPGADFLLDMIQFDKVIENADLVITGEGRIDCQTIYNKAPIVVAKRAKKQGIKVIAIVGCLGQGYETVLDHGIDAVYLLRDLEIGDVIQKALHPN